MAHCACVAVLVEIIGAAEVLSLVHQLTVLVYKGLCPVLRQGLVASGKNGLRWIMSYSLLAPRMTCCQQIGV